MTVYVSGLHALNIPCSLHTSGDWHRGSLDWDNPYTRDTRDSVFGDWGIEEHEIGKVANHIRAVLDILEEGKKIPLINTFHYDFISTSEYDDIIREKSLMLQHLPHYPTIKEVIDRNLYKPKYTLRELRISGKLHKHGNTFNFNKRRA